MSCRTGLKSAVLFVLLLTAAVAPSRALTLSVVPAQPVEGTPFTLVLGLEADCAAVNGVFVSPGSLDLNGQVNVTLLMGCPFPFPSQQPRPLLLEVPIGPLAAGRWNVRVELFGTPGIPLEFFQVDVQALPFQIELDPPFPQAGSPFTLRLSGTAFCIGAGSGLQPGVQDGNVLSFPFNDNCPILPPPPRPFVIEQSVEPLPSDNYVIQITDLSGRTLASHRFHVFGSNECTPSETALCLQNGRFRVEATWRTATAEGAARARPQTADTGALWFFSPTNLEMLVKVLSACQTPRPAFWVFAAGLTDVDVELTVTDMVTKETRRYRNPLGRSFEPILDTSAFSC